MSKKLYVGGLPYAINEQELEELFAAIGTVTSAVIIKDRFSGQSKGFGFVEMSEDADADKAISQLNDTDFKGRKILVTEARPQEERKPSGGGFGGGRGDYRRN